MFQIFVAVYKHQRFKFFISQMTIYQTWTFVQQCWKFVC